MKKNSPLHAYDFSKKTYPFSSVALLHEKLIPYSSPFILPADHTYLLSQNENESAIILMTDGIYSLCHAESDLYVATGFSPGVIGFIDGYGLYYNVERRPQHYIFAETECVGYLVPINIFLKCADQFNLWHDISRILAHRLMVMSAREGEIVGVNSYTTVRALLSELWIYPENYRTQISVEKFIQRRSGLSRAQIMRVLSDLRKGGYLKIVMGKLIDLGKLPHSY
ncbi:MULTISPECIES: helix-turn-helix domain-containing protein [Enterobacterales]|uniref:winged helix-turn-helix transcriptional regulator n=1 Tax=Enterobacterales TaxID=91347 RepID=UPI002EDB6A9B